jgi:hypothetical protein
MRLSDALFDSFQKDEKYRARLESRPKNWFDDAEKKFNRNGTIPAAAHEPKDQKFAPKFQVEHVSKIEKNKGKKKDTNFNKDNVKDISINNGGAAKKYVHKYTNEEIVEKTKGYIVVPKDDIDKIDVGEFVRFYKGENFYAGGQIVYFGYHREKKTPFWIYTTSLIPIDGKFASRYTVYWKDITKLWKKIGKTYEFGLLWKRLDEITAKQEKIMEALEKAGIKI